MTQPAAQERSIGELFADLARETGTLVRQEVQLAKTEMSDKASHALRNVALVGAGGALACSGLLALMGALIIGLSAFLPMWLAALVVGVATVIVGLVLVQRGVHALRTMSPVPAVTVQTLKEDQQWAKGQLP